MTSHGSTCGCAHCPSRNKTRRIASFPHRLCPPIPMRSLVSLFVLALFLGLAPRAFAQPDTLFVPVADTTTGVRSAYGADGTWSYELDGVTVSARTLRLGQREAAVGKEALHRTLAQSGVTLIRRGTLLASDVYLDGFKRGDVELVIDGERYPNSCPSRMDPPATRVNPLEIDRVRLDKSSSAAQSGLGGQIAFERAPPSAAWSARANLVRTGLHDRSTDAALALEGRQHRFTGRFVEGASYDDADGRSFGTQYGYQNAEVRYRLTEVSMQGGVAAWSYGASFSYTEDIPFPYLRMDERTNRLWSAYVERAGHKLYVNQTHHVMDNGLRGQAARMFMETDARNLSVGLTGPAYEVFYRNWDAWNTMVMQGGMGVASMEQHLMPDLHQLRAAVTHEARLGPVRMAGKLGLSRISVGDDARLGFFEAAYPEAEAARWFVPFSLSASVTHRPAAALVTGLTAELASAPPSPEYLYVGVQRPMGKPAWVGNPTLAAPKRATLRGLVSTARLSGEVFGTVVADYAALVPAGTEMRPVTTYETVSAVLTGASVQATWGILGANAAYTWAHNLTDDVPLPEIAPLQGSLTLTAPRYRGVGGYVSTQAAAAQGRVDERLHETRTSSWVRLDAGVSYALDVVEVALDVENLTNALYVRHLSYLRDPFAAGTQVYEPGRLLRMSLRVRL